MKDYKLSEIKKICKQYQGRYGVCSLNSEFKDIDCPIFEDCQNIDDTLPCNWEIEEDNDNA